MAILMIEREVSNLLTGETEIYQVGEIEIVTETTSRKNCSEYTTDDRIHGCLLERFLQLAYAPDRTDSPLSTLHEGDFVNFIPKTLQRVPANKKPLFRVQSVVFEQ